jgi:hypothetical protein
VSKKPWIAALVGWGIWSLGLEGRLVPPSRHHLPDAWQPAARPDDAAAVRVQWNRPGYFFPVLGWREPVVLAASAFPPDALVAPLEASRYNCHFYTKAYLRWRGGERDGAWIVRHPHNDQLTEEFLVARGYRKVSDRPRTGDVALALRRDFGRHAITHSAIVLRGGGDAELVIRQKFNPTCPVVDLSLEEFRMLYAGMHPWRVEFWRNAALPEVLLDSALAAR